MKLLTLNDTQKLSLRELLIKQVDDAMKKVNVDSTINLKYSVADLFKLSADYGNHTICFTPKAWCKLRMLTLAHKTEVAAHGVVNREQCTDGSVKYWIVDILVYPQAVNGGHVESVDEEYGPWLMSLPNETFNHLRFQYHSHCNFSTSPSSTDLEFYSKLSAQVKDFYIFMIGGNKDDEFNLWIYDKNLGVIFETKDLFVQIEGMSEWVKTSNKMIRAMAYAAPPAPPVGYHVNPAYQPAPSKKNLTAAEKKEAAEEQRLENYLNDYQSRYHRDFQSEF